MTFISYCVLALPVFLIQATALLWGPKPDYDGTLLPVDPQVCVSQNMTFTCTLLSEPQPNKSIIFFVQPPNLAESSRGPAELEPVNESDVTKVNESVSIYNMLVVYEKRYMIRCYYSDIKNGTRPPLQAELGKSTTVIPSRESNPVVTNFTCIAYNYLDSMNCSWVYEGYYQKRPDVTFLWRIKGVATWTPCPELNQEYNFCFWENTDKGDFSMKQIEIKIRLDYPTCANHVASSTYLNDSINTREIVKPNPVLGLASRVVNSTCIELRWETSRPNYTKRQRITVVGRGEPAKVTFYVPPVERSHNYLYCGLEEDTQYKFSVAIKPTEEGYWSSERSVENKTLSSIPAASPAVVPGGYAWNPQDCKHENRRSVCIMMQPIDPIDENGDMEGIKVNFKLENSDFSRQRLFSEDSRYGCEDLLLCNESYKVTIVAYNDVGLATNTTSLYIEKWRNGTVQPSLRVDTTNKSNADGNYTVHLRWTHPSVPDVTGYYVFWCTKEQGGCKGNGDDMKWKFYPANVHEALLSDISSPEELSYGVSLVTDQGSSGLQWVTCTYTAGVCPTQAVQNILVTTGSEDNSLVVNWDKLPCRSGQPYISHYIVKYCQENTGDCRVEQLGADRSRTVLRDLEENAKYSVKVKGMNEDGCAGPYSQLVSATPVSRALKSGTIIGIAIGGITLVFLAAIGLVCCVRRGKIRFKVWKTAASAIKLPDIDLMPDKQPKPELNSLNNLSIDRQFSNDSGVPETPKPDEDKHHPFIDRDGYCVAMKSDDLDHSFSWSPKESPNNAQSLLEKLERKKQLNVELRNETVAFQTQGQSHTGVELDVTRLGTRKNEMDKDISQTERKDSAMTDGYKKATINSGDNGINGTSETDHNDSADTKLEETMVRKPSLSCFIPKPADFTSNSGSFFYLSSDESKPFTADHSSIHDHRDIPDYVKSRASSNSSVSSSNPKVDSYVKSTLSHKDNCGPTDSEVSSYVISDNPNAGFHSAVDRARLVDPASDSYVTTPAHNAGFVNDFDQMPNSNVRFLENDGRNMSDFDDEPDFDSSPNFDHKPHINQISDSYVMSPDQNVGYMTNAGLPLGSHVRSHDQNVGHMTNADLTPSSHVRSHDQNVGHMTNADRTPSSYLRSPDRNIGDMTKADSYVTLPERIDVGLDKNLDIKLPSFLDQSPDPYVATPDEAVEVFNQSSQVSGLAGACKRLDDKQALNDRPDAYVTTVTPSLQLESTHSNMAPSDSYITPPPVYDDNLLSQCLIRGELSSDSSSSLSLASYHSSDNVQSAPQNVPDLNVTPDPMVDSNGNDLVHNEISPSVTDSIAQENDSHDNASSCSLLFCQTSGNNNGIHKICSSVVTSPYVDADQMAKLNLAPMVPKVSKSENVQYPVSNEGSSKALDDSVLVNASIKQQSPHNQSSETGYVQLDTILQQNVEPVQSPELDNQSDTSSSSETEIAVGSGPVTNDNLLENELHIDMNKNLVGVHQSDYTEVSKMMRQRQETLYSPTPMDVNSDDSGHRSSRNDSGASDSSVDSVTSTRLHLERSNKVRHNSDSGLSNLSFETAGIY